jgi:exopolysaccharide biosynthesis protein
MRPRIRRIPLLLFLTLLVGALLSRARAEQSWTRIGRDLELLRVERSAYHFFSKEILFIRTSQSHYRVAALPAQDYGQRKSDVRSLAKASRALLAINANFFDQNGDPLGLVVSRGIVQRKLHRGGNVLSGVFQVTPHGPMIVNREYYGLEPALEAIQAGPRLIAAARPVAGLKDSSGPTQRAGICIDQAQRLIFYITLPGIWGLSMQEMTEILALPEINCLDALNLDGGQSAQFYLSKDILDAIPEHQEIFIEGGDTVPVALALFLRK